MTTPHRPASGKQLLTVTIAYAGFVILGLYDGSLGVAWPPMRADFGVAVDGLGLLLLVGSAGHILASFSSGRLVGQHGIWLVLVGSSVLGAVGGLAQMAAPTWTVIVIAGFVAGLGRGLMDSGMNTFASARFRPRLLNWLHASFGIGSTSGALLITGLLAVNLGWRAGFAVLGVSNLVLALLFLATRPRWQLREDAVSAETPTAPFRDTLRLPIVWLSVGVFILYTGIELSIGQWTATLLVDGRGMAVTTAGLWTTLYWGSLTIGRIVLGFIETDLVRLVRFALVGLIIGAALFAANLSTPLNLIGLMLAGFSQAPIFPSLIALTPQRVGTVNAPNAIGFEVGAAGVGAAILPAVAGSLGARFGLDTIMWLMTATAVAMLLLHELIIRRAATAPATTHPN